MGELDRITLHMALCLEVSYKPRFHLWRIAKKYKRKSKNENVILAMNAVLRDVQPELNVRSITDELFN
jgi:hypothetical protein